MQPAELKLQGQPGRDARLGLEARESLCVGGECSGAGSHSQALGSLLDLEELRTVVCGNLNGRLDRPRVGCHLEGSCT